MKYDRREYPRTCRLCGKIAWEWDLVKYSTRHYAHARCFIERKTMKDAATLSLFDRRKLEGEIWQAAIDKATIAEDTGGQS